MEECKVLDTAIKSCKLLERSLHHSISEVRRLNIRYNVDWLIQNYNAYIANIWTQYHCKMDLPKLKNKSTKSRKTAKNNLNLTTRSSQELCGNNRKINYKFIKIKRGMEAMMLQLQRTIEIANRQRNFIHFSFGSQDSKTRICCH
ncbi:hypothetical protein FF38_06658 [Lucilia cuprina]|uniref:Uncharacterized protein n=1 Tax=Lucilia cuprina TaxID=7375 RepID=A0A0L0CFX0_LUCCU|nr:hypothetical protein FF38_06658 [Lucilia cuprina]